MGASARSPRARRVVGSALARAREARVRQNGANQGIALPADRDVPITPFFSPGSDDPVLIAEVKRLEETCTFVQHFNLSTGLENQYPTSVRLVFCGENRATDSGEISIMKAIQGNDFLYLLRLNKRVAAFEDASSEVNQQEVGSWSSYLSRIKLCDASREEHPCPDAD